MAPMHMPIDLRSRAATPPRRGQAQSPATVLLLLALITATAAPAMADEADRQFTFAVRLMQQGEADLASEALTSFIRQHGDDRRVSDAYYYLALLARQRGDRRRAELHLSNVRDPVHVSGEALHLLRGQLKLEAGDARGAAEALERVDADKLPDHESRATWSYLLGTAYRGAGNREGAARRFSEASEADSAVRGLALVELGKVRVELGQWAAAGEALREALSIGVDSDLAAEARALAAEVAYEQRQYERSADLYRQVVERHQTSEHFEPALIGRLRALYAAGEYEQLLDVFEPTRELLPARSMGEAMYLAGAAHVRLERYDRGAAMLREMLRRYGAEHESAADAAHLYAVCLYRTDKEAFERWLTGEGARFIDLETHERGDELQYLWARSAADRDAYAEAVERLKPLVDDAESRYAGRALLRRAALRERLGERARASTDYALYAERYAAEAGAVDAGRRAVDLAFAEGDWERTVELADRWLDAHGERGNGEDAPEGLSSVRFKRAASLIQLERDEDALAQLERLLADDPEGRWAAHAHLYRGVVLFDMVAEASESRSGGDAERIDRAVDALEAALGYGDSLSGGERVRAMELIGHLHWRADRPEEALAAYERLRRDGSIAGTDSLVGLWAGRGLHERGDYEAALAWLGRVLEAGEGEEGVSAAARAEVLFLSAEANRRLDRWGAAVRDYRRLIALSAGYEQRGRLGLARALAGAGDEEEALEEYDGLMNVGASAVAAAALLESGLIHAARAQPRRTGGQDAEEHGTEARRRLNRVALLYDVRELRAETGRALLGLVRLAADAGDAGRAAERVEQLTGRPDLSDWHDPARAERLLLEGRRSEAVHLLRRTVRGAEGDGADERDRAPHRGDSPSPADYARERLDQLGASR